MDTLPIELKAEIASCLQNPFLLGRCSRNWYNIVNSPYTKYRWILNKYGRVHALFHAVRIGKPLLNVELTELLLKNTHISRYFVYRLKLGYGTQGLWGSNISNDIYECILNYKKEYTSSNCDDMQSIRQVLEGIGNEDNIKTIIESHGFTPFPISPTFRTCVFENFVEYQDDLFLNGYASALELKIVAQAIVTFPNLLNSWRKIGYHEITTDLANTVVQQTLLNLYSTSVASGKFVAEKLYNLQLIGFSLTDTLLGNAILLFRRKLVDVGKSLIEGFSVARKLSRADILDICLIELLDPTRNLEHTDALNYVINSVNNPEKQILSAFEKYRIVVEDGNNRLLSQSHSFLKYPLVIYRYMLRFGARSAVVRYLMKEIIIVHTRITNTAELGDADTILGEYYATNVPFERSLLPLFKECPHAKPISYLFSYLSKLFEFEVQDYPCLAFEIPEVDMLTLEQTKKLWLGDIQKCIEFEELTNDEFKIQITGFFALYNSTRSSFAYNYEQFY